MAKSGKLIGEHIEAIAKAALRTNRGDLKNFIRKRHGIYALYKGKRLYYVGLAVDLMRRLDRHVRDRHSGKWNRFSIYLTVDERHLKDLETLFLRMMLPRGNQNRGRFVHAEDRTEDLHASLIRTATDLLPQLRRSRPARRPQRRHEMATRRPLASLVPGGTELRGTARGHTFLALVEADGGIVVDGTRFSAPSSAAMAVLGRERNGWEFWHFKDERGNWVPLDLLRNRAP